METTGPGSQPDFTGRRMPVNDDLAAILADDLDDATRLQFDIEIRIAPVQHGVKRLLQSRQFGICQHQEFTFFHLASVLTS